jgi:hypothetical protein
VIRFGDAWDASTARARRSSRAERVLRVRERRDGAAEAHVQPDAEYEHHGDRCPDEEARQRDRLVWRLNLRVRHQHSSARRVLLQRGARFGTRSRDADDAFTPNFANL